MVYKIGYLHFFFRVDCIIQALKKKEGGKKKKGTEKGEEVETPANLKSPTQLAKKKNSSEQKVVSIQKDQPGKQNHDRGISLGKRKKKEKGQTCARAFASFTVRCSWSI